MVLIGKIHEISFYGLISTIICIVTGKVQLSDLLYSGFHVNGLHTLFLAYMFWASLLFVPIAITGAIITKYFDGGEGLYFKSNNVIVIVFIHIVEEIIGFICTPLWFVLDLLKNNFDDSWKVIDYITYALEICLIFAGFIFVL